MDGNGGLNSPRKRPKKHRKRHILPGPAGQWFQNRHQSRPSSSSHAASGGNITTATLTNKDGATDRTDTDDGLTGSTNANTNPTKHQIHKVYDVDQQHQNLQQSTYSQAWDAMCLSLDRIVPCHASLLSATPSTSPTNVQRALRRLVPSAFTFLRDIVSHDPRPSDLHPTSAIDTICDEPNTFDNQRLTVPRIVFQIEAVHCHGHCDWTAHLTDESTAVALSTTTLTNSCSNTTSHQPVERAVGWLSENLVKRRPEWIRPGVVMLCANVGLALFEETKGVGDEEDASSSTLLLLGEENVVYAWTPEEAAEEVTNEKFLGLLERRVEVEEKFLLELEDLEGGGKEQKVVLGEDEGGKNQLDLEMVEENDEGVGIYHKSLRMNMKRTKKQSQGVCHEKMVTSKKRGIDQINNHTLSHEKDTITMTGDVQRPGDASNLEYVSPNKPLAFREALPFNSTPKDSPSFSDGVSKDRPLLTVAGRNIDSPQKRTTATASSDHRVAVSNDRGIGASIQPTSRPTNVTQVPGSPYLSETASKNDKTKHGSPVKHTQANECNGEVLETQCTRDSTKGNGRVVTPSSHNGAALGSKTNEIASRDTNAKNDDTHRMTSPLNNALQTTIRNPYQKTKSVKIKTPEVRSITDLRDNSHTIKASQTSSKHRNQTVQSHVMEKDVNTVQGKTKEISVNANEKTRDHFMHKEHAPAITLTMESNQNAIFPSKNRLSIRRDKKSLPQIKEGGPLSNRKVEEEKDIQSENFHTYLQTGLTQMDPIAPNKNNGEQSDVAHSIWASLEPQDTQTMDLFDEQQYESHVSSNTCLRVDNETIHNIDKNASVMHNDNSREISEDLQRSEPCNNTEKKDISHEGNNISLYSNMDTLHELEMDDFLEEDDNI